MTFVGLIIVQQPLSGMFRLGSKNILTLKFAVKEIGDTSYQWEKYHPYTNSWIRPSHRTVDVTSPKLIFKMITVDDEGTYRCIATDNGERVVSKNATITVFG